MDDDTQVVGVFAEDSVYLFSISMDVEISQLQELFKDREHFPVHVEDIYVAPKSDPLECIPSSEPSGVPTPIPTSTNKPSNSPVHSPSLPPSHIPTPAPSYSYQTNFVSDVNSFVSSKVFPLSVHYVDAWLDNSRVRGSCHEWDIFSLNTIPSRQYLLFPSELVVSSMSWPSLASRQVTCTVESDVNGVVSSILNLNSVAYRCDDNSVWKINKCGNHVGVCVGCNDPCTSRQSSSFCSNLDNSAVSFSCLEGVNASFDATCATPSGIVNVFSVKYSSFHLAPSILAISTVNKTSNSLILNISTSSRGIVHCIALPGSEKPSTIQQVVSNGFSATTYAWNDTILHVAELQSLQDYGIFCAGESLTGVMSSISEVLGTEVHETTACCRKVYVSTMIDRSIYKFDEMRDFLSLSVLERPLTMLKTTVALHRNGADVSDYLFPSKNGYVFS